MPEIIELQAVPAPVASAHRFYFHGRTSEYFGIWVVNLFLSILTLGIFSAWAKTRRLRYFYGNTFVDGHNFDYHARPVAILKGRVLIVAILAFYKISIYLFPPLALLSIGIIFFIPWAVNTSLSFNARNTSYRTLRFSFHGSYWRAFAVYVAYPFGAILTMGLLWPAAARARWRYLTSGLTYAGHAFSLEIRLSDVFWQVGATIVIGSAAICLWTLSFITFAASRPSPTALVLVVGASAYLLAITVGAFHDAGMRRLAISALSLNGEIRFSSLLERSVTAGIAISNAVAIVASLGLLRPWAAIRAFGYQATCVTVSGSLELVEVAPTDGRKIAAYGSEYADIGGVDLGF